MRINVITPFVGLGGGMRIIAGYCTHLAKRGHEVTLLPGNPPRTRLSPLRNFAARIGLIKKESYFDWNSVKKIEIDFDSPTWRSQVPDADALISTWWSVVELAATLPPRNGHLVHLMQGDERVLGCPPEKVIGMWRQPATRVAVSRWVAQVVRQETGIEDIHVIRNAVDTKAFDAPIRRKNKRPTLGYIFSPHECKGADTAAAVIERVRDEIKDLQVVCFGSMRPRFNGVRPPKGVHFIHSPRQSLIPALYAQCDVWLSTSRSEGSCLPPQEAMACRTPAVVTEVGDFGDSDMFGSGCFVLPVGDVDGLASRAIHVLRSDDASWAAMSQAAWQAIRNWSWDQATDELERILALGDAAPMKSASFSR